MIHVGLTGGIASGKSTVAQRLVELGAVLIDADAIARAVVLPGTPGLAAICERFGEQVLGPDGSLDRPALGSLVFADPQAREALNAIVHPLVRAEATRQREAALAAEVVVEDIPLLVETGQAERFDSVWVVVAPRELRIARMLEHRAMTRQEAEARIDAQASDEQRAAVADVLLQNDGSLESLRDQVDAHFQALVSA
ncbi:dephospho-CoA kinase [Glutamicibacter sp. PS]|uniref:dephospho-CoA kinase n=1 Tax=Glutamicibacter sp. PS TaxID=3075634 RepID=UPI0028453DED|nr:dephospho-CoA kinase [Glutamicibacter sp. PS]MDR4532530.1 dephospho-CoA kinase [Glutamicibacter sp. PS]